MHDKLSLIFMENQFQTLENGEDVLSLEDNPGDLFIRHPMFKVCDLLQKLRYEVLNLDSSSWDDENSYYQDRKRWLTEGLECEILKLGDRQWQKGKLRVNVTLEFCPDGIESPLDDIRQMRLQDKD
jgi:KGK domain